MAKRRKDYLEIKTKIVKKKITIYWLFSKTYLKLPKKFRWFFNWNVTWPEIWMNIEEIFFALEKKLGESKRLFVTQSSARTLKNANNKFLDKLYRGIMRIEPTQKKVFIPKFRNANTRPTARKLERSPGTQHLLYSIKILPPATVTQWN